MTDAQSRFVRGYLTAGQHHDAPQALPLLDELAPAYLIADRGYDTYSLVAALAALGTFLLPYLAAYSYALLPTPCS